MLRRAPIPATGDRLTLGELLDVILTRNVWIHRVDVCRATDRPLELTAEHDGRLVADVVRDWADRHGRPFTLHLTGPAGGPFARPGGGPALELDAVERPVRRAVRRVGRRLSKPAGGVAVRRARSVPGVAASRGPPTAHVELDDRGSAPADARWTVGGRRPSSGAGVVARSLRPR